MANSGTTYDSTAVNSAVNESTDTVYGQLQKHTDFKAPVMQRVAQQAKDGAAGRGLGNTTIAQRAATGAVVDQAGKFAMKDAEIYSARRTENQRANTALTNTTLGNEASLTQTRERNENALAGQRLQNAGQLATVQAQTASNERVAATNAAANNWRTKYQADSTATNKIQTATIDADVRREMNALQQKVIVDKAANDTVNSTWTEYQKAIAGIDANASTASQKTLYERIKGSFEARLTFVNSGELIQTAIPEPAPIPDYTF